MMIDRDVGVVDMVSLEEAKNVEFPLLALRLIDPFVEKRFGFNKTESKYLDYLKGKGNSNLAERNDYENITLNLGNYFLYAKEIWKNDSDIAINSSLKINHENSFNGFNSNDEFMKCFSLDADFSNHRYIKNISFFYNRTRLLLDWKGSPNKDGKFGFKLHDKGQFLIGDEPYFSINYNIRASSSILGALYHSWDAYDLTITELETIEGRSSRNKRCSYDFSAYDKMIVEKHVSQKGCRPPYILDDRDIPLCNGTKEIQFAKLSYGKTKTIDHVKPCNRISRVLSSCYLNHLKHIWRVSVTFPDEVRTIVQSREVDIHTLIGNIGGYLGLITGYAAIQIPAALFGVLDRFRNYYTNL